MGNRLDLVGQSFGLLTVIADGGNDSRRHSLWICQCSCINKTILCINSSNLRPNGTQSCGCLIGKPTHHMTKTSTYKIWHNMIQRCTNTKNPAYQHYGGRGITVCESWLTSFAAFYADMGARPPLLTLERRENDGHYEKSNCYWATREAQSNNTRHNRLLTYEGKTQNMTQWSKEVDIPADIIRKRLRRNVSVEKALTQPVRCPPKEIAYQGRSQTLRAWEQELILPRGTLYARLRNGWNIDLAMTCPILARGEKQQAVIAGMAAKYLGEVIP